jgi:hypothetical protein
LVDGVLGGPTELISAHVQQRGDGGGDGSGDGDGSGGGRSLRIALAAAGLTVSTMVAAIAGAESIPHSHNTSRGDRHLGADPGGWLAHAARRARQSHARLTEAEQDAERTLLVTGIGREYALQVAVEAALAPLSASQVQLSLEPLASPPDEQGNRGEQSGGSGGASAWVLLTFGSAQMAKRFCQKQERKAALCTVPWRFESLDAYRLKELRTTLRYESKVMAADPQRDPDRLGAVREILSSGVRVAELYRYRAEPEAKVAAQAKAAERRLVELTAGAEGLSAREERERTAEQERRRVQRAAQVGGVAGPCTHAPPPPPSVCEGGSRRAWPRSAPDGAGGVC